MKAKIESKLVSPAIGPYSQAVCTKTTVFVSGQLPIDAAAGKAPEGIKAQTKQSIMNIMAILKEDGLDLSDVVKTTVLLADINDFKEMNSVYGEYFTEPYPARSAFQVAALPTGALVEIEAVAERK